MNLPSNAFAGSRSIISIPEVVQMVRRQKWYIATFAIIAILLSGVFAYTTKPLFKSTVTIMIGPKATNVFEDDSFAALRDNGLDSPSLDSQVEIIKSEHLAKDVIAKLGLNNDPEFIAPQNRLVERLKNVVAQLKQYIKAPADTDLAPEAVITQDFVDAFEDRLDVQRVGQTYVLEISFMSQQPERAATIANTMAEAYINDQLESNYDSVKRTSTWMEGRIAELQKNVVDSDYAVERFMADNKIFRATDGSTLTAQPLQELTNNITSVATRKAELEAKYNQLESVIVSGQPDATVLDALDSTAINALRTKLTDATAKMSELASRVGADHESVQKLRDQVSEYQRLIVGELERIAQGYAGEIKVAQARVENLQSQLADSQSVASSSNEKLVQLRELERQRESSKDIYQSFLDRYKSTLQRQSFPVSNARILSVATAADKKSYPKTAVLLFLGLVGGLAIGVAIGLLREISDRVFRSPDQIESILGVQCLGVAPLIKGGRPKMTRKELKKNDGGRFLAENLGIFRFSVNNPFSRFSETLRVAKISADIVINEKNRVIGVISSIPHEGKSVIACNLAQLIGFSGKSGLIIDADMRSPNLSNNLAPMRKSGLVECIVEDKPLEEMIFLDPVTGVSFLPANGRLRVAHTSELMGSQKMREIIDWARERFDYVILDLPPLAPVVDARVATQFIDQFIFVVEWGKTSFSTATHALHSVPELDGRLLGVVLNKVDVKTLPLYVQGNGDAYHAYGSFKGYFS